MINQIDLVEGNTGKSEELKVFLHDLNEEFGLTSVGKLKDMTDIEDQQVRDYFNELAASGYFVLHGTSTQIPDQTLTPRPANDAAKESGNKTAIYATVIPDVALMMAILNRSYLRQTLNSYTFGEDSVEGKIMFKASPDLYNHFAQHDPSLTADGFIYVLDRSQFVKAPDTATEFHKETKATPLEICKVSARLGGSLFIVGQGVRDTIFPYTKTEMEKIAAFNKIRGK